MSKRISILAGVIKKNQLVMISLYLLICLGVSLQANTDINIKQKSLLEKNQSLFIKKNKVKLATIIGKINAQLNRYNAINQNNIFDKEVTDEISEYLMQTQEHKLLKEYFNGLNTLNLAGCNIDDKQIKQIVHIIKKNKTIQKLDLSFNSITEIGAKSIAYLLKNNPVITDINLELNYIKDNGVKAITQALEKNITLTSLNLSVNNISDEGARYISNLIKKNNTLKQIKINDNNITAEGAVGIAIALK